LLPAIEIDSGNALVGFNQGNGNMHGGGGFSRSTFSHFQARRRAPNRIESNASTSFASPGRVAGLKNPDVTSAARGLPAIPKRSSITLRRPIARASRAA
jgi:hypothetical protein